MPRRRAPTALRLRTGPLPVQPEPKHVLPLPPLPTFYPDTLSNAPARPRPRITIQPSYSMQEPTYIDTSSVDIMPTWSPAAPVSSLRRSTSNSSLFGRRATPRSSEESEKFIGPWDRSRSFSFGDGDPRSNPITPPKPVALSLVRS